MTSAGTRDAQRPADELAALQEAAYGAIESLVTINVAQSKDSREDAARWDEIGNILGVAGGVVLILVATALLIWLRGRAFEPILDLASAMNRFGNGDHDARAPEYGARELREMCARFNEMADSLAAQRRAQLAFLGGVAHDLRNPLSALQLAVSLLTRKDAAPSEAQLRQTTGRISRQIARMERMLGDFLDMAKIEAGELELRCELRDLRPPIREVVALFEGTSSDHPIVVELPEDPVRARVDQLRIEQVMTNLISNAIKYSPRGGRVEVILRAHGHEVELSVSDHGIGISENHQARIFEPFRRVGLSREQVPGVGLGLFVVRKIVEAHHGRIEVDSALGCGSTFRVFLPLVGEMDSAV